jgi:hypothetical protein
MKRQKSCGPRLGKLVHQLPGVINFAYDLHFRRMIDHWKGIIEEIHFGGNNQGVSYFSPFSKKHRLGPQNGSGSKKLLKIVNYQNCQKIVLSQLEKVGGHRYPPGSINPIINSQIPCNIKILNLIKPYKIMLKDFFPQRNTIYIHPIKVVGFHN